eukprot:354028-Chlamydomonas_euryale.AAC.7
MGKCGMALHGAVWHGAESCWRLRRRLGSLHVMASDVMEFNRVAKLGVARLERGRALTWPGFDVARIGVARLTVARIWHGRAWRG